MPPTERQFDSYLSAINQSELKSVARLWGVRSSVALKKPDLIEIISQRLADPERVRAALEILTPFERAALALMRWAGRPLSSGALVVGLRAAGVEMPKARHAYEQNTSHIVQGLIRRGLLLNRSLRDPSSPGSIYERAVVFSDSRLLHDADSFQPVPFDLAPADSPERTLLRRPPTIALDLARIVQGIQSVGSVHLTRQGDVRTADLRRLAKALGWSEERFVLDGLAFPQPVIGFIAALEAAGLLARDDNTLSLHESAAGFAQRPYAEQLGTLMYGFIEAGQWTEISSTNWYFSPGDRFTSGRLALVIALLALPVGDAFFALDDLERALFARIGEHFSLSHDPQPPYSFNKDPEAVRRAEQEWRNRLRAEWLKHERLWVMAALTTWLYYLGIVELGFVGEQPVSVRLTELGRAILSPESAATFEEITAGPAWLVQPDFEIVVYLDQAAPGQIAFVERHAERIQAQPHVARYRLTRESVYQGLERGTTLDELLESLRAGAAHDLPQNVAATVREWAARREQITLHRRAQLLEFADQAARQQALDGGMAGAPVGERFVLLATLPRQLSAYTHIDYTLDLPRCLAATEDGIIRLARPAGDLLLHPQLGQWATAQPDGTWQLSSASVAQAIRSGASISQLIGLLQARLTHPLPPLLGVVLRAWAGRAPAVALAGIAVLRCTDPAVFAAIAGSALLKPYFRGALAPDLLLVEPRQVPALRERLAWAGLDVSTTIEIVGP